MKNLKKTLALMLTLVMLLSAIPFSAKAVDAPSAAVVLSRLNGEAYDGVTPIRGGDSISFDVTISRDAGAVMQAFGIGYSYDSDALTYTSVTWASAWEQYGVSQVKDGYTQLDSLSVDGTSAATETVATINFKVNDAFSGFTTLETNVGTNYAGITNSSGVVESIVIQNVANAIVIVFAKTNKTALESAINTAEALNESDYRPSSWATLATPLGNAKSVYASTFASQTDIDNATTALINAIAALEGLANKASLEEAIETATTEIEKTDMYTAQSLAALKTAVQKAIRVYNNTDATQAEVDAQTTAVTNAIAALERNTVTVTFLNYDGSTFDTQEVVYGGSATLPEGTPQKPADNTFTYTFSSWSGSYENVTADTTITPVFTSTYIDYTITFKDEDGTTISTATYHYGNSVVLPASPEKAEDNTYTYSFAGWSPEVEKVTGDQTYTATYNSTYKNYVIKFVNYDNSEVETYNLHWGDEVTAPNKIPVREADKTYTYAFAGWSPELRPVDGDATYTAQFISDKILYTVKFVNYDGTVILEDHYAIGDTVTVPAENPTKPTDDTYYYTFKAWSPEVTVVDGAATYTATFDAHYVDADYSAVDAAEAAALKIDADAYTETSYNRVTAAIAGITRGLTIDRQAEVDAMAKAINDAVAALVTTADYEAAWAKCAAVNNDDNRFTAESYAAFTAAMNEIGAKQDFDNDTATQADVDAAAKALNDAYNLLVAATLSIDGASAEILDGTALVIASNSSVENSQLIANDGGAGISELRYIDADGNAVSGHVLATGYKVQLIQGGEVKLEKDIVIYGDINGDGQVSIADIALARKLAVSTDGYSTLQIAAAQCGSDSVSVDSVINIAKA